MITAVWMDVVDLHEYRRTAELKFDNRTPDVSTLPH